MKGKLRNIFLTNRTPQDEKRGAVTLPLRANPDQVRKNVMINYEMKLSEKSGKGNVGTQGSTRRGEEKGFSVSEKFDVERKYHDNVRKFVNSGTPQVGTGEHTVQ